MENDSPKPMIPSTVAAARFGVTNDYVALLCRQKKVQGALIGRVWYVEQNSLSAFLEQSQRERAARNAELKEKLKKEYRGKNKVETEKNIKQNISTSLKTPISLDMFAPAAFAFFIIAGFTLQAYAGGGALFANREPIKVGWQPLARPVVMLPTPLAQETLGPTLQSVADALAYGLEQSPQGPTLPAYVPPASTPTLTSFVATELAKKNLSIARALEFAQPANQSASVASAFTDGWCVVLKIFNKDACPDTSNERGDTVFVYEVTPTNVAIETTSPQLDLQKSSGLLVRPQSASGQGEARLFANPTEAASPVAVAPVAQTATTKYVTQDLLSQKLDELSNSLKSLVYAQLSVPSSLPATGGFTNMIALSNKIDNLSGVTITNATITGGSIAASSIPPLSDLSGILAITKGGTGTSSAPTYGKLLLGNADGGYDLVATSSLGISGSGSSQWTTSGSDIYYTTGSVGIGTTSPWAQLSINPNGITGPAFAIGSSTQTLFRVDVTGNVSISGALTVASCTGCGGGAYPFDLAGNATSTLTQFNGGLTAYASSTIGSGAQGGGLTVLGGATTTGNMLVRGNLGLGTSVTTPGSALQFSNLTDSIRFGTSGYSFITGGSGTLALGVQGSSESIRAGTSGVVAGVTPTTHSTPTYAFAAVRRSGTSGSTITPVATFLNTLSSGNPSNGYGTSVLLQARLGSSDSTLVAHEAYWADINSSGTSNYDIRLLRAGATTTLMSFIGSSGNVGIGTTSPYARLSVEGASALGNSATAGYFVATSSTASSFAGGFTAYASSTIGNGSQAGGLTINGGATTTGVLYVTNQLGVGNVRPRGGLDVGNSLSTNALSGFKPIVNISTSTAAVAGVEIRNISTASSAEGRLMLSDNWGALGNYLAMSAPAQENTGSTFGLSNSTLFSIFSALGSSNSGSGRILALGTVNNNALVFGTNDTERARFTAAGNFGLGTSTPYSKLSVWSSTAATGARVFEITDSASTTLFRVDDSGNATLAGALTVASCTGCGGGGAYPFSLAGNATSTPLMILASTTIGDSTQTGGLTINGGATTTADAYVLGSMAVGTGHASIVGVGAVASGYGHTVTGNFAGAFGGYTNTVSGNYSFTAGGQSHNVSGMYSGAFGRGVTISGNGSFGFGLDGSSYTISANNTFAVMGGKMGIGTTSPWAKLSVNNYSAAGSSNGPLFAIASSTGAGATTTAFIVDQYGNVGIGTTSPWRILSVEVADANGIFSGTGATPLVLERRTVNSNVSLEFRNTTASWFAGQGSGGDFNLDTDNNLGGAPKLALTTGGALTVASCTGCSSDQRLKTNVTTLASSTALEHLQQLRPVTFTWAGPVFGVEMSTTTTQYGFIAQEALEAFPDLVYRDRETELTPGGTYLFNYQGLISPIVAAIQEIAAIGGAFKDALVAWLGDATNGITKLFAKEVHTDKLCVGNTCVTEEEFLALVAGAGISSSPTPAPAPVPEPEPTPAATSTPSAPEAPAEEPVAESEPEPTPDETILEPPPAEPVASEPAPEAPAPAGEPTALAN